MLSKVITGRGGEGEGRGRGRIDSSVFTPLRHGGGILSETHAEWKEGTSLLHPVHGNVCAYYLTLFV